MENGADDSALGWFSDVTMEEYHGPTLTPELALSASGARTIIESPKKFWWNSWLNPDREPERKEAWDIGNAVHMLVMEPELVERRIQVIEFADWRTQAARDLRDASYAAGKIPLLTKDWDAVRAMRDAVMSNPMVADVLGPSPMYEQTFVWRDSVSGRYCRARPDVFRNDAVDFIPDLKTTVNADAEAFTRQVFNLGYHQQAAWCIDGVNQTLGTTAYRRFYFIVVEKTPPYLTNVIELDGEAIDAGRRRNHAALGIFNHCMATDDWPEFVIAGALDRRPQKILMPPWVTREDDDWQSAGWYASLAALRQRRG